MYMGTPHAREVVKGKLLLVTEDQMLTHNVCLHTGKTHSMAHTVYSVHVAFNTN